MIEIYDSVSLNCDYDNYLRGTKCHVENIFDNLVVVTVIETSEKFITNIVNLDLTKKGPILLANSNIDGVNFRIGDKIANLTPENANNLKEFVTYYIDWYNHWKHFMNYYKNYSKEKIIKLLNKSKNADNEYSIGENFAAFTYDTLPDSNTQDNYKACEKVKELWEKEYGKDHTLKFDPECSYCYVYTKDFDEAIKFKLFVYNNIVKPELDKLK
jgi:hypothetical protein